MTQPQPESELERRLASAFEQSALLGAYATEREIEYVILETGGVCVVRQPLDAMRRAHAFSGRFPLLSWDEREMADACAVRFDELPDPRPFFITSTADPAPVVANGEGLVHVVVGPVHAGVNEPGRFVFSSGGETVVHLDAALSFTHRGVERHLEGMPAVAAAPYVARICGSCSVARSFAYARAIEQLACVSVAAEVESARVVVAELERIYNHISDLAGSASGAGFGPGTAKGLALKEEAMRLNRLATGHRLLFDAIVPGGVGPCVRENLARVHDELPRLQERVERYVAGLFSNASLVSRWHLAGVVHHRTAKTYGAVGPTLRASKGNVDVRSSAAYGAYGALQPRISTATGGDTFARCAIKRDELVESFRLIREALAQVRTPIPQPLEVRPQAGMAVGVVEGPRGAETAALHVDSSGALERAHFISASYRNWPVVTHAMDGNIIPDFPLVNHSFSLCYACCDR